MSKIFSTALLVSCAAAQLTTSIWMPGADGSDMTIKASVMNVDKDRTTLSLALPTQSDSSDTIADIDQTVTIAGNTYYGFDASAENMGVSVHVVGECTRKDTADKEATCTMSTKGLDAAISSLCGGSDPDPDVCNSGNLQLSMTTTLPEGYFNMAEVIVTAGQSLLPSASAAASPSVGSASPTASPSGSASGSASGSDAAKSDKPTASGSHDASHSSKGPEATGAAAIMNVAPALAGLGAAAAFFL